jgi:hypothetical protein
MRPVNKAGYYTLHKSTDKAKTRRLQLTPRAAWNSGRQRRIRHEH